MDEVQIILAPPDKSLLCYTFKTDQGTIRILESQRNLFLRGLGEPILGCNYSMYYEDKRAKRYAIPALGEYETIAVKEIRTSIIGYPDRLKAAWIVSPFVREDLENYKKLKPSKETFAEQILNAKSFSWVVDWVQKYHLGDAMPEQEQITNCYRQLIYAYCEALEKTDTD